MSLVLQVFSDKLKVTKLYKVELQRFIDWKVIGNSFDNRLLILVIFQAKLPKYLYIYIAKINAICEDLLLVFIIYINV